jgi:hypothetical protein
MRLGGLGHLGDEALRFPEGFVQPFLFEELVDSLPEVRSLRLLGHRSSPAFRVEDSAYFNQSLDPGVADPAY